MAALVLEEGAQLTECSLCQQRFTDISGNRAPRRLPCACSSVVCHSCADVSVIPAKECPFCKNEIKQKTATEFELSLETLKFLKWLWAEYEIAKIHDLADQVCQNVRDTENQAVQKIRDSEFSAVMGLSRSMEQLDQLHAGDNEGGAEAAAVAAAAAQLDGAPKHKPEVDVLTTMMEITKGNKQYTQEEDEPARLSKNSEFLKPGRTSTKKSRAGAAAREKTKPQKKEVVPMVSEELPEIVHFLHVAWSPLPSRCLFMITLPDDRIVITFQQKSIIFFYSLDTSNCLVKDAQLTHPEMKRPMSLAAASKNRLLVSCNAKAFHGVLLFSLNTGELLAKCGDVKGVELGIFNLPLGLAVCPNSELLYVADSTNHRIQVLQINRKLAPLTEFGIGEVTLPTDVSVYGDRVYVPGRHGLAVFEKGGLHRLLRLQKPSATPSYAISPPSSPSNSLNRPTTSPVSPTGTLSPVEKDLGPFKDPGCCAVDTRWQPPLLFVTDPERHLVSVLNLGNVNAKNKSQKLSTPQVLGELHLRETEFPCAIEVRNDCLMLTVSDGQDWRFHIFKIVTNAAAV